MTNLCSKLIHVDLKPDHMGGRDDLRQESDSPREDEALGDAGGGDGRISREGVRLLARVGERTPPLDHLCSFLDLWSVQHRIDEFGLLRSGSSAATSTRNCSEGRQSARGSACRDGSRCLRRHCSVRGCCICAAKQRACEGGELLRKRCDREELPPEIGTFLATVAHASANMPAKREGAFANMTLVGSTAEQFTSARRTTIDKSSRAST